MEIGKLRQRITLQQQTIARDIVGGEVITWADVVTVWGAVEPNTGTWYFAAKQANSKVDGRVRIRHRTVEPTWRIKFGDRYLSIISILNPDESKKETVILYTEALD